MRNTSQSWLIALANAPNRSAGLPRSDQSQKIDTEAAVTGSTFAPRALAKNAAGPAERSRHAPAQRLFDHADEVSQPLDLTCQTAALLLGELELSAESEALFNQPPTGGLVRTLQVSHPIRQTAPLLLRELDLGIVHALHIFELSGEVAPQRASFREQLCHVGLQRAGV